MLKGSKVLSPVIRRYSDKMSNPVLEVGPFFTPLIKPGHEDKDIFYLDNDRHVVKYLRENFPTADVVHFDLNLLAKKGRCKRFQRRISKLTENRKFGSVIASHLLNYIDYRALFSTSQELIEPEGLFFINNVIDYGIPPLFHPKRPKSDGEIKGELEGCGFKILEEMHVPGKYPKTQNERLVLVAER
ncbi:MAG: hypothetical protein ACE5FW_01335 [Candidatus Aenigmatarchaeota archaeon]